MTRRLLDVTAVTAYTERGPVGECSIRELPLESAEVRGGADFIEVAVHAQLPVENPILEHPTFRASRALTLECALPGDAMPMPETPILCLYQHKEWWMRPSWVNGFEDAPERTQMVLWRSADGCWHVLLAVSNGECRADIRGAGGCAREVAVDVSTNQVGHTTVEGLALLYAHGDDPYALVERCARRAAHVNGIAAIDGRPFPEAVGHTTVEGLALLYAHGDDPYALVERCARRAAHVNGIAAIDGRPFPEALRGLGWCTWDSLGQDVSEDGILAKMDEFKAKQVPVSWVLIDDGWSQTHNNKLTGFEADPTRFPQGLAHTIDVLKRDYGVRYVGVWQAFHGYWGGVDLESDAFNARGYMFETLPDGMTVPSAQPTSDVRVDGACRAEFGCGRFWWQWDEALAHAGVDFAKVDAQSTMSVLTRGAQSYGTLLVRHRAVDLAASACFNNALINCMGMAPENYWSRPTSPITRTSDDFFPRIPESLPEHAIENAYCSLLMGCLYHCDWDMFWTKHPDAHVHAWLRWFSGGPIYCSDALGETEPELLMGCLYHCDWDMFWTKHPDAHVHAWLRWFSGGPIYCSDALGETEPETLWPFFGEDGTFTHPDGVGVPVVESLLADPEHSAVPLGIRNTFHGEDVVMFLGLNADARQTAHIDGDGSVRAVRNLETGERFRIDTDEPFAIELSYGAYAVFAIERDAQ